MGPWVIAVWLLDGTVGNWLLGLSSRVFSDGDGCIFSTEWVWACAIGQIPFCWIMLWGLSGTLGFTIRHGLIRLIQADRICCRCDTVSQCSHSMSSKSLRSARCLPMALRKDAMPFPLNGQTLIRWIPWQISKQMICLSGYVFCTAWNNGPFWKTTGPTLGAHSSANSKICRAAASLG